MRRRGSPFPAETSTGRALLGHHRTLPIRTMPIPTAELVRLEEARQVAGCTDVALEAEPVAGGVMTYSAPGCWSNMAMGMGLDGPVEAADVDRVVDFYRARDCAARVEVAPEADASLLEALAAHGFVLRDLEYLLVRELHPTEDLSRPPQGPPGLEIERVDPADDAAVAEWVDVSTCGFRAPDEPIPAHFEAITTRIARHARVFCLTARLEGRAVGGAAGDTLESIGALFGTSVHPDFRRRGVQLALMRARLEILREAGARLATVGSRPGVATARNAARLGFRMGYTRVGMVRSPAE